MVQDEGAELRGLPGLFKELANELVNHAGIGEGRRAFDIRLLEHSSIHQYHVMLSEDCDTHLFKNSFVSLV